MGRGLRGLAAIGTSVVGLAVFGPGTALAGTLDQHQTDVGGPAFSVFSGGSLAQTFTAGRSGGIDRVDLYLAKLASPNHPLTVEIRNVASDSPGSVVLASQSVPATSVPLDPAFGFVPVNFSTPAPVLTGAEYTIVAFSSTANTHVYEWKTSTSLDAYGGGAFFSNPTSPPFGAWTNAGRDTGFRTYVAPPTTTTPPPTVQPTGERAAALKKCKKKHSHKKRKKCRNRANLLPV